MEKNSIISKIVKAIIGICFRVIIFVAIVFVILFIIDKILYIIEEKQSQESKFIDEKQKILYEYNENIISITNSMNDKKLMSGFWNYEAREYTIIKKGEILPKKGDKKRILVIGDSFVWGWGHDNINNLWWKQLNYIIKQNGYQNVEIVAAGMNGFSIVDETEKIILNETYIEKIEPDLIILGFVSNDWEIWDKEDEYYVRDSIVEIDKYAYIKENYNYKLYEFMEKNFRNIYNKLTDLILEKEYAKEEFKEKYGYTYKQRRILYHTEDYMTRIKNRAIEPLSKVNIPLLVVNLHYESEIGNSS